MLSIKVALVGDRRTGKSSIYHSFDQKKVFEDCRSALNKLVYSEFKPNVNFEIFDMSASSDRTEHRKALYKIANLVIVCYSLNNRKSLLNIREKWYQEIRTVNSWVPIFVVGTKYTSYFMMPASDFQISRISNGCGAYQSFICNPMSPREVNNIFSYYYKELKREIKKVKKGDRDCLYLFKD